MDNPKLFISYSWSSPEHEEWVLELSNELVENGVDVKLDKWDLKEGHDAYQFMESMVTDDKIRKVIVVCDEVYAKKADERKGGVGTEAQIISKEVYEQVNQNKFVALVKEKDEEGKAFVPTFFKSKIYIDFSDIDSYVKDFETLLRWIYDKPLYVKPELGKKPSFLADELHINLGTSSLFKRVVDSIKNGKSNSRGILNEYLNVFSENLEKFRLSKKQGDEKFDEKFIKNIDDFIPYRNEMIEIFSIIAQYNNDIEIQKKIHIFFENIYKYTKRPTDMHHYHEIDFDNYKFIIQELFLYTIAVFLKHEYFDAVSYLLNEEYYFEDENYSNKDSLITFINFKEYLYTLEHRNNRLKLNRLSLHADLLKERSEGTGIRFEELMQADFVLYLKGMNSYSFNTYSDTYWWPDTLLYAVNRSQPFKIFAKAKSEDYMKYMFNIFGLKNKQEFIKLVENIHDSSIVPKWDYRSAPIKNLMNLDKLYE